MVNNYLEKKVNNLEKIHKVYTATRMQIKINKNVFFLHLKLFSRRCGNDKNGRISRSQTRDLSSFHL